MRGGGSVVRERSGAWTRLRWEETARVGERRVLNNACGVEQGARKQGTRKQSARKQGARKQRGETCGARRRVAKTKVTGSGAVACAAEVSGVKLSVNGCFMLR